MNKYIYLLASLMLFSSCEEESFKEDELPEMTAEEVIIVNEDDGNQTITINVSLSRPFELNSYASFATSDGSAIASTDSLPDYVGGGGTIEFLAGETESSFEIRILDDLRVEGEENFFVNFSSNIFLSLKTKQIEIIIEEDDANTSDILIPETGYSTPENYDGYTLVWRDEFNGTSLSNDWTHEIGNGNNGWGNQELQYYRPENTEVKDGYLQITAKEESFGGSRYTSSRIITENKQEFQYGRIDIRAVMPKRKGLWPALWMLGANFREVGWPFCGEIDIMEMVGGGNNDRIVHGTAHWFAQVKADFSGSRTMSEELNKNWHVYSIIWDENFITWYIDDIEFHKIAISGEELSEFREPFFFIFNVAVGGQWPGSPDESTVFPQRMAVDYVRVFQKQ